MSRGILMSCGLAISSDFSACLNGNIGPAHQLPVNLVI